MQQNKRNEPKMLRESTSPQRAKEERKLRHGILLRQRIIDTQQAQISDLEQQISLQKQAVRPNSDEDKAQEVQLLLEELLNLNQTIDRMSEREEEHAAQVEAEQARADEAEEALADAHRVQAALQRAQLESAKALQTAEDVAAALQTKTDFLAEKIEAYDQMGWRSTNRSPIKSFVKGVVLSMEVITLESHLQAP